ncbi:hypothetical protein O181_015308 [Austropuccinia psidii MF-1]|uniref:Uncharacterized protein n=1 Tax=Austropuccinia psidii MF-1 TaxID=1389203 RepID=A0A9Q3C291_9BASI|nr:hypothetical protein [Austropuccinia psidii MF-1]
MLITCEGKFTIINPVGISKGKFPKAAEHKSVQGAVKVLESQGTSKRKDKHCSKPQDQGLDTIVDSRKLSEVIPMLPFTFQFKENLKLEDWKNMDQVLQRHKLLKDVFQWRMDNERFNLASHWEEPRSGFQKICLKEIPFKDFILMMKECNLKREFKPLEDIAGRLSENQATIQAIEE